MQGTAAVTRNMLESEARALLARLKRLKPFALHETMVPAAALSPAAQVAIERFLIAGRRELRRRTRDYIQWLRQEGARADAAEMQRRFTLVRIRFNDALSQFDLFADAITQRSEQEMGVYLSGLDVVAADALRMPRGYILPPPVVCYLDRGPGAAIRRVRTRLPGGVPNPAAIIRVPRERMVGHGIASSLFHEVGHQVAALLDVLPSLKQELERRRRGGPTPDRMAWEAYERWISEIVADFWSVSRAGLASTLGLIGVVSLPRFFVFRVNLDDPHPMPWLRVLISAAIGNALYPHQQWSEVEALWRSMYPSRGLDANRQQLITGVLRVLPRFVEVLAGHRPAALRGRALIDIGRCADRTPEQLDRLQGQWGGRLEPMRNAAPSLVFAVMGQARARGSLDPEAEALVLRRMLTYWALRSSLDTSAVVVAGQRLPISARSGQRATQQQHISTQRKELTYA